MAKGGTKLVDDFVDDEPAKSGPAVLATLPPPAGERAAISAQIAELQQKASEAAFPWGWLIKHPSFGAMRIRRDEAKDDNEAVEVYRKRKCPHLKFDTLVNSGLRLSVLAFQPADTERGK